VSLFFSFFFSLVLSLSCHSPLDYRRKKARGKKKEKKSDSRSPHVKSCLREYRGEDERAFQRSCSQGEAKPGYGSSIDWFGAQEEDGWLPHQIKAPRKPKAPFRANPPASTKPAFPPKKTQDSKSPPATSQRTTPTFSKA